MHIVGYHSFQFLTIFLMGFHGFRVTCMHFSGSLSRNSAVLCSSTAFCGLFSALETRLLVVFQFRDS